MFDLPDRNERRATPRWRAALSRATIVATTCCMTAVTLMNAAGAIASPALPAASTGPAPTLEVNVVPQKDGRSAYLEISTSSNSLPTTLHVLVNGKDASNRLDSESCNSGPCLAATLGREDGLKTGKNVIGAYGKMADGRVVSGRARFGLTPSAPAGSSHLTKLNPLGMPVSAKAGATQAVSATVAAPFLPPTVSLYTNYDGGYQYGGNSWLTVGQSPYPTSSPQGCGSGPQIYTAIVFDRTQLTEKTTAPENSPMCLSSGAALTQYLQGLPNGDLVVVTTNFNHDADLPFDTSAIGGKAYQASDAVGGYMIIGATGATPGTAYESRFNQNLTFGMPQARGILQEDAGGNYNFLPSEVIRYVVMPNAPAGAFHAGAAGSAIQMSSTAKQLSQDPTHVYRSYTPPAGTDGFWMLVLNRSTLEPVNACTPEQSDANVLFESDCGKFYGTNSSTHDSAASQSAYAQLASDLNAAYKDPWQLVILTTVGNATCCDWMSAVAAGGSIGDFTTALTSMGGTPSLTTYPATGWNSAVTSAYTLVTASGLGNALSGTVAESSTVLLNDHGQTGTIMGTLQRNNDGGLFTPADTNQEYPQLLINNGGMDNQFVTTTVALQQPVAWPALDQSHLLPGADSIQGQIGAYRFISYSLLTNKYIVGASGSHLDDLHYFFTSSLSTNINYHYFDPIDLPWPGAGSAEFTSCTSVSSGASSDDTCNYTFGPDDTVSFTYNDFIAVRGQTSKEVEDLTNVMVYFLTGSTNLKDVVISGNSSVGVALTGAAATILGSDLVPDAAHKSVQVSWESILGAVNGILTIAAGVPGIADLAAPLVDVSKIAPKVSQAIKVGGAISNEVAGAAGLASGAGTIRSTSTTSPLPARYSKFSQTIAQLANGVLEDQMASGFDAVVDSIASDWGRLSNIGPRVVDSDDPAFFSPDQTAQITAIQAATTSASQQFYLGLMPTLYQVHYWHAVAPGAYWINSTTQVSQPDMQYGIPPGVEQSCATLKSAFYLPTDPSSGKYIAAPDNVFLRTATVGGQTSSYNGDNPFSNYKGPIDMWIIATAPKNLGESSESIKLMDTQLASTLFSSSGLALPMQQFVSPTGPMAASWYDAGVHTNNQVIGNIPNADVLSHWFEVQQGCAKDSNGENKGGSTSPGGTTRRSETLLRPQPYR
jgi:hypothetical protein